MYEFVIEFMYIHGVLLMPSATVIIFAGDCFWYGMVFVMCIVFSSILANVEKSEMGRIIFVSRGLKVIPVYLRTLILNSILIF